jgi:hypothetical protein
MLSLYGQDEDRGAPAGTNDLGGVTGTGSVITGGLYNSKRAGEWHKHNTIFVINPSKVCNVQVHTTPPLKLPG